MAVRLLKAGTLRQSHRKTVKRCDNGCSQPAVARDLKCGKDVCWFHLVMEHPSLGSSRRNKKPVYLYYGP